MIASTNTQVEVQNAAASFLHAGSLPFAVALLRANDGRVVLANHLMSVILRRGADELIGKTIPGLYDDSQLRSSAFKLLKKSTFVPPKQIKITNFDNHSLVVTAASSLIKHQNQLWI